MTDLSGPRGTGPKQRQRHYSYDENADESGKLIDKETTDVEHETPSDQNEPVERPEDAPREPPGFQE